MIVTAVRTYREVAALLGISHAQVIIDERRALAKIRAALEEENDHETTDRFRVPGASGTAARNPNTVG